MWVNPVLARRRRISWTWITADSLGKGTQRSCTDGLLPLPELLLAFVFAEPRRLFLDLDPSWFALLLIIFLPSTCIALTWILLYCTIEESWRRVDVMEVQEILPAFFCWSLFVFCRGLKARRHLERTLSLNFLWIYSTGTPAEDASLAIIYY